MPIRVCIPKFSVGLVPADPRPGNDFGPHYLVVTGSHQFSAKHGKILAHKNDRLDKRESDKESVINENSTWVMTETEVRDEFQRVARRCDDLKSACNQNLDRINYFGDQIGHVDGVLRAFMERYERNKEETNQAIVGVIDILKNLPANEASEIFGEVISQIVQQAINPLKETMGQMLVRIENLESRGS